MRFFLLFAYITAFAWLLRAEAQQNINSLTTKDIKVNGNLEVNSISLASKPCPAMTEAQRNAIASPQSGRCVYNSNTNQLNIFNGTIWKSAGGGISNWETAFNYAINDVVIESNKIYQCNTAHTSTVFASDIANWTQIANNVSDASGVLPMANGGTDKSLTPTIGGVVYTDANSMEVLAAGTSGQVLKSNGAAAPTWQDSSNKVQGQEQSEVDFTKLQFKNKSITETSAGVQLVESERNLLANGSFEHTTYNTGWTVTGSATIGRETTVVRDGKASFRAVTTGNSFRLEQNTTQLQGTNVPAYAIVWVHNTAPGVQVCSTLAGSDKDCVTALTNGTWQPYIVPMILGGTSNGISVNSGTTTGTTYVDWVRLVDEDLVGTSPAVGPRVAYTPTFQGLGTVTNITCFGQQIGTNEIVDCNFVSGTPTATEARVSLRSGLTTPSNLPLTSITGGPLIFGASNIPGYVTLIEPNVSYITFGLQSNTPSSVGLTKLNGNGITSGSTSYSFKAIVPIAQYQASVPTYSDRCRDQRKCEVELTFKGSSSCVVTDENVDWISGNGSVGGAGVCTYTINSGIFTNSYNCTATPQVTGGVGAQVTPSTITSMTISTWFGTSAQASAHVIKCSKTGQDYINAKVNQIVGSFKDYVRTPNTTTGKVGFCSAKISATGVISDQLGGCFASCTNATTPVCTFTSNYWRSGSVPNCWHTGGTSFLPANRTVTSTTYSGIIANNSGGPAASGDREYFCHGEIQ